MSLTGPQSAVSVTVVVPVRDAEEALRSTLECLLPQASAFVPGCQVVVVDDGSADDATARVAGALAGVTVLTTAHGGPAGARNRGAEVAAGEVLVFLDAGDLPLAGWLEGLANPFADPAIGIVSWSAAVTEATTGHEATWSPDRYGPDGVLPLAGCFALRRSLFCEVGGYDPVLRMGENSDLCERALRRCAETGMNIVRQPEVNVEIEFSKPADHYDHYRLDAMEHLLSRDAEYYAANPERRSRVHGIAAVNAARCERWDRARVHAWQAVVARPAAPRAYVRALATLFPPLARRMWTARARRGRVQPAPAGQCA